jgi:hypothetical protein
VRGVIPEHGGAEDIARFEHTAKTILALWLLSIVGSYFEIAGDEPFDLGVILGLILHII